ncbi:MAG: ATP-dependent Clp protease proteolytic subunit [Candidatus Caldarchaeum sp.]
MATNKELQTPSALEQAELDYYLAAIESFKAERKKYAAEAEFLTLEAEDRRRSLKWARSRARERRVFDFVGEVSEQLVRDAVDEINDWAAVSKDPITIRLNSPGGGIFDGLMFYDFLREIQKEGITVITHCIGYAASMASIISQAGTVRRISKHSWFMVHEPSSFSWGKMSDMKDEAELLKKLHKQLMSILAERSILTEKQITERCARRDWWLSAEESIHFGFFDELV